MAPEHKVAMDAYEDMMKRGQKPNPRELDKAAFAYSLTRDPGSISNMMAAHGRTANTSNVWAALIRSYCWAGDLPAAFAVLPKMYAAGVTPTKLHIGLLVTHCVRNGQPEQARRILKELEAEKKLDHHVYRQWISTCVDMGDLKQASELLEEMRQKKIAPDAVTNTRLISALMRRGENDKARDLMKSLKATKQINDSAEIETMSAYLNSRDAHNPLAAAKSVRKLLDKDPKDVSVKLVNAVLNGLLKVRGTEPLSKANRDAALELHRHAVQRRVPHYPDVVSYTTIVSRLGRDSDPGTREQALAFVNDVLEGTGPGGRQILKSLDTKGVRAFMGALCGNNVEWPVIASFIKKLSNVGLTLTEDMFHSVFEYHCRHGRPQEAIKLVANLLFLGVQATADTYITLTETLLRYNYLIEGVNALELLKARFGPPSYDLYSQAVVAALKAKESDIGMKLLNEMYEQGHVPDVDLKQRLVALSLDAGGPIAPDDSESPREVAWTSRAAPSDRDAEVDTGRGQEDETSSHDFAPPASSEPARSPVETRGSEQRPLWSVVRTSATGRGQEDKTSSRDFAPPASSEPARWSPVETRGSEQRPLWSIVRTPATDAEPAAPAPPGPPPPPQPTKTQRQHPGVRPPMPDAQLPPPMPDAQLPPPMPNARRPPVVNAHKAPYRKPKFEPANHIWQERTKTASGTRYNASWHGEEDTVDSQTDAHKLAEVAKHANLEMSTRFSGDGNLNAQRNEDKNCRKAMLALMEQGYFREAEFEFYERERGGLVPTAETEALVIRCLVAQELFRPAIKRLEDTIPKHGKPALSFVRELFRALVFSHRVAPHVKAELAHGLFAGNRLPTPREVDYLMERLPSNMHFAAYELIYELLPRSRNAFRCLIGCFAQGHPHVDRRNPFMFSLLAATAHAKAKGLPIPDLSAGPRPEGSAAKGEAASEAEAVVVDQTGEQSSLTEEPDAPSPTVAAAFADWQCGPGKKGQDAGADAGAGEAPAAKEGTEASVADVEENLRKTAKEGTEASAGDVEEELRKTMAASTPTMPEPRVPSGPEIPLARYLREWRAHSPTSVPIQEFNNLIRRLIVQNHSPHRALYMLQLLGVEYADYVTRLVLKAALKRARRFPAEEAALIVDNPLDADKPSHHLNVRSNWTAAMMWLSLASFPAEAEAIYRVYVPPADTKSRTLDFIINSYMGINRPLDVLRLLDNPDATGPVAEACRAAIIGWDALAKSVLDNADKFMFFTPAYVVLDAPPNADKALLHQLEQYLLVRRKKEIRSNDWRRDNFTTLWGRHRRVPWPQAATPQDRASGSL